MKRRFRALLWSLLSLALLPCASAQARATPSANLRLEGLRSVNHQGSFKAAAWLPDGTLVLLADQGDGLRLLKTDSTAQTVLAEAQIGAAGDSGAALTADAAGNLYVAGTSFSGLLSGTSGAVFPSPADTSTNSFLARFDSNLRLVFLSFLGAGETAASAIAATPDAVFVAGVTFSSAFPTTPGALLTTPPAGSDGNAFITRFSTDGTSVHYSTLLNGPEGDSTPAALAADATGTVFVAGLTSSPNFPTKLALQPAPLAPEAGFLSQLAPDGASLLFSTFLAGNGITGLALDPSTSTLLLTGNLALGQFPIATAAAPLANVPYQSLLRLSIDGQTLQDAVALLPGAESFVTPGPNGTAWVTGALSIPLSANTQDRGSGDSFLLHLTASDQIDQLSRVGGNPLNNPAYAHLTSILAAPALSPDGATLAVPGTITALTDPSFRTSQAFDLALNANGSSALPNAVQDLLPASCAEGTSCSGSGGLLALLAPTTPTTPAITLTLSTGDLPSLTLRNPSSTTVTNLAASAQGFTLTTDCPSTLAPFAQCGLTLTGNGPGTVSITSSNASPLNTAISTLITQPQQLAFDQAALDCGIVTAAAPITRTVTVTNLTNTPQTFTSTPDNLPSAATYTLTETASTCAGSAPSHSVAANASCTVAVTLSASSLSQNDGPALANWRLGARVLPVTAFAQAAGLSLSATQVDFGPQPTATSASLPRFLYLSNNSPAPAPHSPLFLPPNSPFALIDGCPATLGPNSVCQITLTYTPTTAPALDSTTLTLDQDLSVLLTAETLGPAPAPSSLAPSPLRLTPTSIHFTSPVAVSGVSTETQTVQIQNTTAATVSLSPSILGDFLVENTCPATLAPGDTCTLGLQFAPTQPGTREGLLTVATSANTQPSTATLFGNATPILPAHNGILDLGQIVVNEPTVAWLQLQGTFPHLTATVAGTGFTVALLANAGNGHGTLPPSAFASSASDRCINCWLAVQFLAQSAGAVTGTLQISSTPSGNPFQLSVRAVAVAAQGLVLTPAQTNFGAIPEGATSPPLTFVLTNLLPSATAATLDAATVTGDFSLAATISATSCAASLQPGTSCSLAVTFSPASRGSRSGTLSLNTSAGPVSVPLQGIGIAAQAVTPTPSSSSPPAIAVFPAESDFGPQATATLSAFRQFTLTNTSTVPQALALSPSRNFPVGDASACATLAPGLSCTFTLAFVPETAGSLTGSVNLTATPQDGGSLPTQTVLYLRGYGTSVNAIAVSSGTDPATPLSFGNLPSGASALQVLTLTNTSAATVTVRRLTATLPFHITAACTAPLSTGESCEVVLTYIAANQLPSTATQTPRTDAGQLLVETDAQPSPLTVYLSGTALASSAPVQTSSLPVYTLSASAVTFPNTLPGSTSPPQTVTVTNTGLVSITFGGLIPAPGFPATTDCEVLQPAASCTIAIQFQPLPNAPPVATATLGMVSNAGNAQEFISLLGPSVPIPLVLGSNTPLDFGTVLLGATSERTVTLTNQSSLPVPMTFSASGDFTVGPGTCPGGAGALPPGQTCNFTLTFAPATTGPRSGVLTVSTPGLATPLTLALGGTGIAAQLQVSPGALNFGSLPLTTSATQTLTLTSAGTSSLLGLTLGLSGPNSADFALSSTCPGDTLAIGATCTAQITFTPAALGPSSATLTVRSSDPASPLVLPLTGAGAQPPGFTLTTNGRDTGSATISSGADEVFPLTLTSQGGYTGKIALTCKPIIPARNATCTLGAGQMTLGASPIESSATFSTLSGLSSSLLAPFGIMLLRRARSQPRRSLRKALLAFALALSCLQAATLLGCGGPGIVGNAYTPPGTYTYQITAASTAGAPLTSTVTLTLTVQ